MAYKQFREALEYVYTNLLEFKSEYPIRKTLIKNDCDCIQDLINIVDTDTQNLCYETPTKELKSLSLGHHNLIRYFIDYFEYRTYNNYPIGDDWMKITNENFNDFRMKYYFNLEGLRGWNCKSQEIFTKFILQETLYSL